MSEKNEYYVPGSIARGMQPRAFYHLSKADKKRLIKLLARVSEKSYRRGFQQGIVIGDRRIIEPYELRFKRSIDKSPYTDTPGGFTAKERLYMEYGVLRELGFWEDEP